MRARSLPLTVLLAAAGASANLACSASHAPPESALVTVNGRPLSGSQFDTFVRVKLGDFAKEPLNDRVRSELLDEFVAREVTLQAASRRGIAVPPASEATPIADASLDEITIDRLVQQYYRDVVLKDVAVTPEEVEAQVRAYCATACPVDGYVVREICVPSRTEAERALRKVAAGDETFGDVAREMSRTPTAPRGGLSYYDPGVLPPVLENAVKPLEPGQISSVVQTSYGYHIFRLERSVRAEPLDEIRARIAGDVLASKNERLVRASVEQLLDKASVSVDPDRLPFRYEGRFARQK